MATGKRGACDFFQNSLDITVLIENNAVFAELIARGWAEASVQAPLNKIMLFDFGNISLKEREKHEHIQ